MHKNMSIDSILIPEDFAAHPPGIEKLNLCRENFKENGFLDRDIVVDWNNMLKDGYVGYIVLKENNIRAVSVKLCDPCRGTLVYGIHPGGDGREYVWRIVDVTEGKENLEVGGRAIVRTKYGDKEIVVTKIDYGEHRNNQNGRLIKRVVKCIAR